MNKLFPLLFSLLFIYFSDSLYAQTNKKENYTASDFFEEGKAFEKKGRYGAALGSYQNALILDPYNYVYQVYAALMCRNLDFYASALYYFEEGLVRGSADYRAYGNLASIQAEMGYDEDALRNLRKALSENSNYAHALNNMGAIVMRYGKYDESRSYLLQALKSATKLPDVPFNIGVAYYETEQLDSALYYYDKALEINPKFRKAILAKAAALKDAGAPVEEYAVLCNKIIESSTRILKLLPDNYEARRARANAYKLLGKKMDTRKDSEHKLSKLNYLIELHPDAYTFINERGNTYKDMGNNEAAIADFKRVLEINPGYTRVQQKLKKLMSVN